MDSQIISLSQTVSNETTVKAYHYYKLNIVLIKNVEKNLSRINFYRLNKE